MREKFGRRELLGENWYERVGIWYERVGMRELVGESWRETGGRIELVGLSW